MIKVDVFKGLDEVDEVLCKEGAVNTAFNPFQVAVAVVYNKIKRRIAHERKHPFCTPEYCHPVPPCNSCSKESGNLNIFLRCKPMGDTHRIKADE